MTENLLVNKFNFRYNGKRFGAGDVIHNVPADLADKLVAEHPGNIVKLAAITGYTEQEENNVADTGNEQTAQSDNSATDGSPEESVKQEETSVNDNIAELPNVDPNETVVKTSKKK